jgi:hypothetical protein
MKNLLLWITMLLLNLSYANNIFEIPLGKTDKLQGTYSALLSNNITAHFVLIRNSESKQYELTPYIVNAAAKVSKLSTFSSKEVPEIISHHQNGNTVSIVTFNKSQKAIFLIDFDINTGKYEVAKHDQKEDYTHLFRLADKTLIVRFDKANNSLILKSLSDTDTFNEIRFTVPAEKIKLFKKISGKIPESLNQEEFVKNGSIAELKAYFSEGRLIYTLAKDKSEVQIFEFDNRIQNDFKHQIIDPGTTKESKELATYVSDHKLVVVTTEKEDVKIKSFDLSNGQEVSMFSARNDLSHVVSNEELLAFLKATSKASMVPTVTVNKTTDNNLAIRIDQVNKTEYAYHYDWWFHHWYFQHQVWHQQQMIRQMQMTMPRGGFGPSANYFDAFTGYMSKEKAKSSPIVFMLTSDFKSIRNGKGQTVFRDIEKDKYVDKYKDDKNIKEFSSEFAESEMRYVYLDRKAWVIRIATVAMEQE